MDADHPLKGINIPRRITPEGSNPCLHKTKYREQPRERFLTAAEFRRLGRALDEAEANSAVSAHAAAAIRLLMLTGCRKNEILTLRRKDVNLDAMELHLAETKTGARTVSLSPEAARVLAGMPRRDGNPWVIQGRKEGERLCFINRQWCLVRERAKLGDVRIHDCRHSCAIQHDVAFQNRCLINCLQYIINFVARLTDQSAARTVIA